MPNNLLLFIAAALLFLQAPYVVAATEITGTITAKRGDSVKVEFHPDKSADPKVGDGVKFSTTQAGIPINCGTGKVTEVDENTVWIKSEKKNLKLKMDAVIHATGSPAPVEYTIDLLSKLDDDSVWDPDGKFTFKFAKVLKPDKEDPTYAVNFPGGAYFSRPHFSLLPGLERGIFRERSLKEAHREKIEPFIEKKSQWGGEFRIVWDRKIQGRGSLFHVAQVIETRAYGKEIERNQEFLISFMTPKPPPGNRKYYEIFWEMSFKIPDNFDEQYRPEYWEKVFLEILQTASVVNNP